MSPKHSTLQWNRGMAGALTGALVAAVDEIDNRIVTAAQGQLVPGRGKRTGNLQRDIQARPARVEGSRIVGVVGTGSVTKRYALRVHRGRKAIVAKAGKVLRIVLADGTVIYRKRARAAKAIPFMVDGLAEVRPRMMSVIKKHVSKVLP